MFTQTWKKYLPVIVILLKRSAEGDQTLSMDHSDFQRAAGGRKIKFSFTNLQLNNGRINTDGKHTPVAVELAGLLQEDSFTSKFISNQKFEFSVNNECKLLIRNNTPPAEPVKAIEVVEEQVLEEVA